MEIFTYRKIFAFRRFHFENAMFEMTSIFCECAFSSMKQITLKEINRLTDEILSHLFRIPLKILILLRCHKPHILNNLL